jgi:endonuclease YncB( thermonuclease family)
MTGGLTRHGSELKWVYVGQVAPPPKKGPAAARGKDVVEALQEAEQQARRRHVGIWEYGDPGSDEDVDPPPTPARAWGAKK